VGDKLDRGLSIKVEALICGHKGQNIWLDVEYQPTHDEHHKLTGFLILALDITERVNQRQKMTAGSMPCHRRGRAVKHPRGA